MLEESKINFSIPMNNRRLGFGLSGIRKCMYIYGVGQERERERACMHPRQFNHTADAIDRRLYARAGRPIRVTSLARLAFLSFYSAQLPRSNARLANFLRTRPMLLHVYTFFFIIYEVNENCTLFGFILSNFDITERLI